MPLKTITLLRCCKSIKKSGYGERNRNLRAENPPKSSEKSTFSPKLRVGLGLDPGAGSGSESCIIPGRAAKSKGDQRGGLKRKSINISLFA